MTLEIISADLSDKIILRNLLELYQHDMSEFNEEDVNEQGEFGYNYLDNYWTEPGRFPFLLKYSGEIAGFALVRQVSEDDLAHFTMAEFFILRKYRQLGLGRSVALQLFERFDGQWRIAQEAGNYLAQEFWRKVISAYTGDSFELIQDNDWDGPVIKFEVNKSEN